MTFESRIARLKELNSKRTQGEWLNGYPNAGQITQMPDHIWTENKELIAENMIPLDAYFCRVAANEMSWLIESLETAVGALVKRIALDSRNRDLPHSLSALQAFTTMRLSV